MMNYLSKNIDLNYRLIQQLINISLTLLKMNIQSFNFFVMYNFIELFLNYNENLIIYLRLSTQLCLKKLNSY